jgi:hypothetical protein
MIIEQLIAEHRGREQRRWEMGRGVLFLDENVHPGLRFSTYVFF